MGLKILFLSYKFSPDVGGIESISEILAFAFLSAGHDVRVITTSPGHKSTTYPFEVIRNPRSLKLIRLHAWAQIVFENNPSLNLSWPSLFTARPHIIALHTWIRRVDGKLGWQDKLKRLWLKRGNTVIACSDALRKSCWPSAVVIPNAYQDDLFILTNKGKRKKSFVFLGRLVSDKGIDLAIKAFHTLIEKQQISQEDEILSLTIIGEGQDMEKLVQMVSDLQLQERVHFKGTLKGDLLVNCLNEHQVLLVPSSWEEPFGMVALEGMACGCMPIVSDGGGLPEAVGALGVVFPRGDVNALSKCMEMSIKRENLDEKYYSLVEKHLSRYKAEVIARRYLSEIELLLK